MESKDPKSAASSETDEGLESKEPNAAATSSETLSDVEETEKVSETGDKETNTGGGSSLPSPDGAFDEGRGGDGLEDAGPM